MTIKKMQKRLEPVYDTFVLLLMGGGGGGGRDLVVSKEASKAQSGYSEF